MPYNENLAEKVREALAGETDVDEKKMFRGLAFMVNGKMCINVSADELMCRFDPDLQDTVAEKQGFRTMIMKGKELKGYCYVSEDGFRTKKDLQYWVNLCLSFNSKAKSSKKSETYEGNDFCCRPRHPF